MPKEADNTMDIGKVLFTKVGEELASICGSKQVEGFKEYILEQWRSKKYLEEKKVDSGV